MEFSIEIPKAKFDNHLAVPENDRIIFSAAFGSGKTYFLKKYFEDNANYNVIHLFPVNYAVASNKDIFELIKYDILFELLGKNVEFDSLNISHAEMLMKFSAKNAHHILAPFLMLIPEVGKSMYSIYDKLQGLGEKYFEEYDGANISDKDKVEDYLGAFTESQGSIYEEDFYTQLICQLVDQLKVDLGENSKKEAILILDDLDRIDPEHIFRILNVLSAHLDQNETGNKFNFSRIILVFDEENVHKIFQNRYGSDVDFSGYIDKFYSHKIFKFQNSEGVVEQILGVLRTIERPDSNVYFDFHNDGTVFTKNLAYVLSSLVVNKQLTIRRLKKIIGKPFRRVKYQPSFGETSHYYSNQNLEIFFLFEFLFTLFGSWEELMIAIENCRDFTSSEFLMEYRPRYVGFALVALDVENHKFEYPREGKIYNHEASDQTITYNTQEWHEWKDSFLCNPQSISYLSNPKNPVPHVKYFPILLETAKYLRDNGLIEN